MSLPRTTAWRPPSPRALQQFLHTEAGGSVLLLAATIVALVWANSPFSDAYEDLWGTYLTIDLGGHQIREDLGHWVNDGLMVFFFYVVGLEIRRELAMGELTDRQAVAVPAVAALAGMVVPAALYLAINPTGDAARGWGVVMATDIAFALGALAILGRRAPASVRVFLLTLAIVDDIGAVTVIAIFYTEQIDLLALAAAGVIAVAIWGLRGVRTWRGPAYFIAGLALWFAMYESGVHPTIAGVLLGVLTPVHRPRREDIERAQSHARSFRQAPTAAQGRRALLSVATAISPNERLQEALHPWTSYVIVPLFALANAGVALNADVLADAASSSVTIGIVVGLVLGKLLGITAASLLTVRSGLGVLPTGMRRDHLVSAAALAGIGFTVSLFIVELAFDDGSALQDQAKIGVLVASTIAAVTGAALFAWAGRRGAHEPARPTRLSPAVDLAHDHVRGPLEAPLELVQYGDLECPYCADAAPTVEEVRRRLGDRVRFVFRHLPNEERHEHARLAAEAVEAAGAQGRYWPMYDRIVAEPDRLEFDDLLGHAQAIGMDVERFTEQLQEGVHASAIDSDIRSALASGADATPTFFVGGERWTGPVDANALVAALEATAAASEPAAT